MTQKQISQFKLLIPANLKARVEAAALAARRSISQEIVIALEEKFPAPNPKQTIEEILGAEALLSLGNLDIHERRERILILNDKLSQAGSEQRITLKNGKLGTTKITKNWSPEHALD